MNYIVSQLEGNFTTYYHSPIGALRISCTDTCLYEVNFEKSDTDISTFPISDHHELLQQAVDQLIEYFNGARRVFEYRFNKKELIFSNRFGTSY